MAKKQKQNLKLNNTVSVLKEKTAKVNTGVITTADELVEGSVSTIKQWQNLFGKALNNGAELFGRQQDFAIDVLEQVVDQTKTGGVRTKQLLNFDINFKSFWSKSKKSKNKKRSSLKPIKNQVKKTAATAKESIDEILEAAVKSDNKTAAKAKKPSVKAIAKNKSTKKTTPAKKDNLTKIDGIGPKIAQLLADAGINNYKKLAKAKVTQLQQILESAGSRYTIHNPSDWPAQAKFAADGNWEDLKKFVAKLKK